MNFAIRIDINIIDKVCLELKYLLSITDKEYNYIINNYLYYNYIIIENNKIYLSSKFYDGLVIDDKMFLYDVELIKKCNSKTYLISNKSNKDYWLILQLLKEKYIFRYRNYYKNNDKTEILFLLIDGYVYIISRYEYNIFFNSYETITSDAYIRTIKLKQIL